MIDIKIKNTEYTQTSDVCATASYGIIIEYFSNGKFSRNLFFEDYLKKHKLIKPQELDAVRKVGAKAIRQLKEKKIYDYFLTYCKSSNDKRGFTYIKEIHDNDEFKTNEYCKITKSKAQLEFISKAEVLELREELKKGGLAMVLYDFPNGGSHSIIIGYDSESNKYFKRDPNYKDIIYEDFLAVNEIREYILFNENLPEELPLKD